MPQINPRDAAPDSLVFRASASVSLVQALVGLVGFGVFGFLLVRDYSRQAGHSLAPGSAPVVLTNLLIMGGLALFLGGLALLFFYRSLFPAAILTADRHGLRVRLPGSAERFVSWEMVEQIEPFDWQGHTLLRARLFPPDPAPGEPPPTTQPALALTSVHLSVSSTEALRKLHGYALAHGLAHKIPLASPVRIEMPLPPFSQN